VKFTITRKFDTRVEKSARVLEVAEAFGLGLTDKQFVIYDGLEIDVREGDVVSITGESGSGKSLLLRDLASQMQANGLKIANIEDVQLLDAPIVDQIGANTDEALKLLSMAGLNDAYLFIRKPQELSDGQKYRFRLAKLIESGANVWVADEFAAVLDRETAKVVAHNMAKTARGSKVILMIATTHPDLLPFLGATLAIEKKYGNRVDLTRYVWGESWPSCQYDECNDPAARGERFCHAHLSKMAEDEKLLKKMAKSFDAHVEKLKRSKAPKPTKIAKSLNGAVEKLQKAMKPRKPKSKRAETAPEAPSDAPDTLEQSV
jgi:ABC-type transport system involved in cytochrome c biogenesis ATPase subunit